jgi:hypothetical protein
MFDEGAFQVHTSVIGSETVGQATGTGLHKHDTIFFGIDTLGE